MCAVAYHVEMMGTSVAQSHCKPIVQAFQKVVQKYTFGKRPWEQESMINMHIVGLICMYIYVHVHVCMCVCVCVCVCVMVKGEKGCVPS